MVRTKKSIDVIRPLLEDIQWANRLGRTKRIYIELNTALWVFMLVSVVPNTS